MRKSVDIDHKSQYSTRGREAAARLVQPRGKLSHSFPTWHGRVKYWIRHQAQRPSRSRPGCASLPTNLRGTAPLSKVRNFA